MEILDAEQKKKKKGEQETMRKKTKLKQTADARTAATRGEVVAGQAATSRSQGRSPSLTCRRSSSEAKKKWPRPIHWRGRHDSPASVFCQLLLVLFWHSAFIFTDYYKH